MGSLTVTADQSLTKSFIITKHSKPLKEILRIFCHRSYFSYTFWAEKFLAVVVKTAFLFQYEIHIFHVIVLSAFGVSYLPNKGKFLFCLDKSAHAIIILWKTILKKFLLEKKSCIWIYKEHNLDLPVEPVS